MSVRETLNGVMDGWPRTRVSCGGREVAAFLVCGVTGFYVALIVLFGGGLLAGRSLLVLAVLALVSVLSFFAYTYVRRWIAGHETLVLLEHVWFALAFDALVLRWMGEPVLPYLDVVSVSVCLFLALGRVGCTLVGCCHGLPFSFGITYAEASTRDGFSRHLIGVRLFPVAPIEAVGLLTIGAAGLAALPVAQPGKVFTWYLLACSLMRFGLEGIRGDSRPHLFGLSQARWMSIIEAGLALWLMPGPQRVPIANVYVALISTLVAALTLRWRRDTRRRLLRPSHVREVWEVARQELEQGVASRPGPPALHVTSRQVAVAASAAAPASSALAHVSLSLREGHGDLWLLCRLAMRAFPESHEAAARFTSGRVLHVLVPIPLAAAAIDGPQAAKMAEALYGAVVLRAQHDADSLQRKKGPTPSTPAVLGSGVPPDSPSGDASGFDTALPWYFVAVRSETQM